MFNSEQPLCIRLVIDFMFPDETLCIPHLLAISGIKLINSEPISLMPIIINFGKLVPSPSSAANFAKLAIIPCTIVDNL